MQIARTMTAAATRANARAGMLTKERIIYGACPGVLQFEAPIPTLGREGCGRPLLRYRIHVLRRLIMAWALILESVMQLISTQPHRQSGRPKFVKAGIKLLFRKTKDGTAYLRPTRILTPCAGCGSHYQALMSALPSGGLLNEITDQTGVPQAEIYNQGNKF
ncbi:hypothetical protein EI94DRAFT_1713719 [Lactarius quietus]|nr:hypothetical protein EI94DRAFT_1713719 [Lactarius quietus]